MPPLFVTVALVERTRRRLEPKHRPRGSCGQSSVRGSRAAAGKAGARRGPSRAPQGHEPLVRGERGWESSGTPAGRGTGAAAVTLCGRRRRRLWRGRERQRGAPGHRARLPLPRARAGAAVLKASLSLQQAGQGRAPAAAHLAREAAAKGRGGGSARPSLSRSAHDSVEPAQQAAAALGLGQT